VQCYFEHVSEQYVEAKSTAV